MIKRIAYLALIFVTLVPAIQTFAISPDDQQSLYGDSEYYWPDQSCGGTNSAVTAGTGVAGGATFPDLDPTMMATAINTWITQENPNSKLSGLGATIVADGKNSNVNPFLIVAIAHEESSLSDPTAYNVIHGSNSFGREAGPGQPSFQGAHSWYLWTSVEASVDYTAPENQGKSYGGDMAAYLRDEYGSKIDQNNLVAMMEAYAPPTENDTAQYIANLQTWIAELTALSSGASAPAAAEAPSAAAPVTSSGCTETTASLSNCTGSTTTPSTTSPSSPTPSLAVGATPTTPTPDSSADPASTPSGVDLVRQDVVCIAQHELATWESQPGYPWACPKGQSECTNTYSQTGYEGYTQGAHEEWCADFASWVYSQAQDPFHTGPSWRISYVPNIQALGEQKQGFTWHPEAGYVPQPGDLAIHGSAHVNIVVSVVGSTITLIGGDQGHGPYPGGSIVSTEVLTGPHQDGITGYVSPN